MRLITRRTIEAFATSHAAAAQALADWCAQIELATWYDAQDVLRTMPNAKPIGTRRVKFNLLGNRYRIVAEVRYADRASQVAGIVYVQFVGTHAAYDEIDPMTVTWKP